ncbi:MAG: 4Fe-4S dicluster domain-containing protein [Desulfobacteraceae bacterium]|nr:4Fe-4S dicluster domain-containing protein [Desulfobacteraceae bacterium]
MIKKIKKILEYCFHLLTRHYDFPTECRMERIGNPEQDSPIFLSGNYVYTVNWLKSVLIKANIDCYLLIADASGSNVWCAAGMNEFTEHDIIDAINVAELSKLVNHKKIIAPPFAAPGVDKKAIKRETGFRIIWGPAHLRDIPKYVKNGYQRNYEMCIVNNDFRDRIEPAMSCAVAYLLTIFVLLIFFPDLILGVTIIFFGVNFFFHGLFPFLPKEKSYHRTIFGTAILTIILSSIALYRKWSLSEFFIWEGILLSSILLAITDMCGSTNIYKTTIIHWLKNGNYESLFNPIIDPKACNGCGECLKVCPKGVLAKSALTKKTVAVNPKDCMECLACVKQCPTKAIYNKKGGKLKNDVKSIPGLHEQMARDAGFLINEESWVGAQTEIKGEIKIVP